MHPAPRRGHSPDFKIAVPEQRREAVTGRRAPKPLLVPFAPWVPFVTPPALHAARVSCSTRSRSRFSIKLSRMARSRRQGQGTRRGRQRANKPRRTVQRPRPHALGSRRPLRLMPVPESAGAPRVSPECRVAPLPRRSLRSGLRNKPAGRFPLGSRDLGGRRGGGGKKGLHPSATLPSSLRWGPKGREGGKEKRKGWKSLRASRPPRPRPSHPRQGPGGSETEGCRFGARGRFKA